MSESASSESGPLSVDQAIAALIPEPVEVETPEAPIEAAEGEEIVGDQPAEDPEADPETVAEGEEEPEVEAVAPVDPPLYWSKEAKAKFSELPPELQAVVLEQEGPREEATAKAKAQAAAEVEKAQKDVAGVQALVAHLNEFLPQAVETFKQRWGDPDWAAVAQEHGADQAFVLKVQHETEQKQLAQLQQAQQTAQIEARKAFLDTEWKQLEQIAPDLTDPEKGQARRSEVIEYLKADGIPKEATDQISAREMLIARKAMLWDRTQAALKAPKTPKPVTPIAQRTPVRPAAAQAGSSSSSTLGAAQARFNLHPTRENAEALLLAKG